MQNFFLIFSFFRSHIKRHSDERNYKCEVCGKDYKSTGNLKSHMRIHTGEKPNKCKIDGCERAYTYCIDLKRHKYSAHGIWTKKYPCQICGKIYPENKLLRKHLLSHNYSKTD